MASKRLTEAMRDEIVRKVISASFDEWNKDIRAEEGKVAAMAYAILYPKEVQEKMKMFPISAFPTVEKLNINIFRCNKITVGEGEHAQEIERKETVVNELFYFGKVGGGEDGSKKEIISFPVYFSHEGRYSSFCHMFDEAEYPKLAELAKAANDARKKWRNDKEKARFELRKLLKSVTTIKRLREVWPESKVWLDEIEEEHYPLMAIDTSALNNLLCNASKLKAPCCPPAEKK